MARFKQGGRAEYGKVYGRLLWDAKREWLQRIREPVLVPVPVHKISETRLQSGRRDSKRNGEIIRSANAIGSVSAGETYGTTERTVETGEKP